MVVTDTHVTFDTKKMIRAAYARDLQAVGLEFETGVAHWVLGKNQLSILGPKVTGGAAEKYHTLTSTGSR
jgi:hypothetical protein